ncbi:MAG: LytR C-terminal domain-containing protein [Candidatus Moranbacteria bacterium]|nr:LytR C-terminal domain-containing protein [Candidatus Moranbacteria bacterium]
MNFFWKKKAVAIVIDPAETDASPLAVSGADVEAAAAKKRRVTTVALRALGVLVVTGSLGTAAYFYAEYKKVTEVRTPEAELESIVADISEHFELPTSETPTLATVTDREKLSGQEFFASSQNGDKVLLYQEGRKAILYRPSTGKIVNVAPIGIQEPAPVSEEIPAVADSGTVAGADTAAESVQTEVAVVEPVIPTEPARIALYNGTKKIGLTGAYEKELLAEDAESYEVVAKENAVTTDYAATVVVDLSGTQSVRAAQLAEKLGVSVEVIPEGEAAPDADILVILGSDRL